jgi:hypothetical protein
MGVKLGMSHGLTLFENKAPTRIFGSEIQRVATCRRKLLNDELYMPSINTISIIKVVLGELVVCVLAIGPNVRGLKPGRGR